MTERIRSLDSDLPTTYCSTEVLEFLQRLHQNDWNKYMPPANALQIPEEYDGIPVLTPRALEAAHRLGVEVHVWTVNLG